MLEPVQNFVKRVGGRKWVAFLLLTAVFVAFVFVGYINTETIIRDILLGLLAVYGTANVGERVARRGEKPGKADSGQAAE